MSQEGQITICGEDCNGARITRCSEDQYSCASTIGAPNRLPRAVSEMESRSIV